MKLSDKIDINQRLIAKMAASVLLVAGAVGVGVGTYLADNATDGDKIKPQQNVEYITGVTSATTGCVFASLGASGLLTPIKSKIDELNEESEDTVEL